MAYGVKYRLEFTDQLKRSKRVDILEQGYSGGIEIVKGSEDPLKIGLQNSSYEKYETILPTYIELTILAQTKFQFEEMAAGSDKQYKIEVYETGALKHVGYIIPEIYKEPYEEPPFMVTFRAVSIGILNQIRYVDDNGEFYTGHATGIQIITRCLQKLGYGLDIWDSTNTWETRMNTSQSPLAQLEIDQRAYIVEDRGELRAMNCWDVLEAVLKPFVVNFFQDYGRWVIIPIEQRASSRTVRVFNSLGFFQSSHTRNPTDDILWIARGHQLQPRPIIREIQSTYEHGLIPGLIHSGEFDDDFNDPNDPQIVPNSGSNRRVFKGGLPEGWTYSQGIQFPHFFGYNGTTEGTTTYYLISPRDGGPGTLTMYTNTNNLRDVGTVFVDEPGYLEYVGDTISTGEDEYSLNIKFRYRAATPDTSSPRCTQGQYTEQREFSQRIQIRVGDQYLQATGEWTSTPTDIEITDLTTARNKEEFSTYDIMSETTNANGQIRARIYRPKLRHVVPHPDNAGSDILFGRYPFFLIDFMPFGKEQANETHFIGERDVESYADEINYPVIHGDGPTNLHARSFLIGGAVSAEWQRGDLMGGISKIAIQQILREYETRSNVIQGRQRVQSLFDRYFAEFGEAYTPLSGVYNERSAIYDGQVVQIQAGDIQGTEIGRAHV